MFKKVIALMGGVALSLVASFGQAATIDIAGVVTGGTGVLPGLIAPPSPFAGSLEWTGTLDAGLVNLPGFCFTSDATGAVGSITSATCAATNPTGAVVPILETGETTYPNASALTTYQQVGTTFDGTAGDLLINTFSPTLNQAINIVLAFDGVGGGTLFASNPLFGTLEGEFSVVPVPAAAWLFGSALLGLAGIKRRKLAA